VVMVAAVTSPPAAVAANTSRLDIMVCTPLGWMVENPAASS
jgi:hypothetical protein